MYTIYLIYSGIYFLEKKFKNKTFRFKSVEKGCILGLESLFEGEKSKYRCTLKLSSLNEFGIVAYIKINKLLPYIAKKMREVFKENYYSKQALNLKLKSIIDYDLIVDYGDLDDSKIIGNDINSNTNNKKM